MDILEQVKTFFSEQNWKPAPVQTYIDYDLSQNALHLKIKPTKVPEWNYISLYHFDRESSIYSSNVTVYLWLHDSEDSTHAYTNLYPCATTSKLISNCQPDDDGFWFLSLTQNGSSIDVSCDCNGGNPVPFDDGCKGLVQEINAVYLSVGFGKGDIFYQIGKTEECYLCSEG